MTPLSSFEFQCIAFVLKQPISDNLQTYLTSSHHAHHVLDYTV